jgi:HlyD family secretion protein
VPDEVEMKRTTWIFLTVGVVLTASAGAYFLRSGSTEVKWRMATVERGTLRQRISATGTLSAMVQVNVGTQVSGTISALFVDYNSKVTKGQTIAQIDPTLFQAALDDAKATLSKAETGVGDTKRQYARATRLHDQKLTSDQDLEAAQVAAEKADGDLMSARAALSRAKANLSYCTITAPVSGVVVSRAVDVGQTVAASFSTPTLFVIAQDLTKMKLLAAIDEADIGQVQQEQKGQFTVDSFPDEQFKGTVSQVRLEPIVTQNVVTYNVQIDVDNPDLKLRPGMTANVSILTDKRDDVLKVPASALRFNPLAFMPAQNGNGKAKASSPVPNGKATGNSPAKGAVGKRDDHVWVLKDKTPVALSLKVGITDGQATEVSGEGVVEGLQVLVGVEDTKKGQTGTAPIGGGRMGRP